MTPEGKVKKKISELLKKYDVYYFMPRGTIMGRSGIPDYICCVRGRFLAIEAKAGKNELTALQGAELGQIMNHGGTFMVVWEKDIEALERLLSEMNNLPYAGILPAGKTDEFKKPLTFEDACQALWEEKE